MNVKLIIFFRVSFHSVLWPEQSVCRFLWLFLCVPRVRLFAFFAFFCLHSARSKTTKPRRGNAKVPWCYSNMGKYGSSAGCLFALSRSLYPPYSYSPATPHQIVPTYLPSAGATDAGCSSSSCSTGSSNATLYIIDSITGPIHFPHHQVFIPCKRVRKSRRVLSNRARVCFMVCFSVFDVWSWFKRIAASTHHTHTHTNTHASNKCLRFEFARTNRVDALFNFAGFCSFLPCCSARSLISLFNRVNN